MAITKYKIIWNNIILIIALNLLHNNFKIITLPFFHLSDKDSEEIQLIVISTKTANLAKQVTGIIGDLAMMERKKEPQ